MQCRQCGRLEYGFLRVRCGSCQAEKLMAFRCKRRGFCPSCGARCEASTKRMNAVNIGHVGMI